MQTRANVFDSSAAVVMLNDEECSLALQTNVGFGSRPQAPTTSEKPKAAEAALRCVFGLLPFT